MPDQGRVLFVTGRLAEPSLRRVLEQSPPPFAWDLAVMKITVAALMTTDWIGRFLKVPEGTSRVCLPGLCEGDISSLSAHLQVPVERGPRDLRELPVQWGRNEQAQPYGAFDIEILAEINNAPKLTPQAIHQQAEYFRQSGADVIDVGCTPGVPFPGLGTLVAELVGAGHRVSIDTFDQDEIRLAVEAGATWVLSVNATNIDIVPALAGSGATVVAVPDADGTIDTLDRTLEALEKHGLPAVVDPILVPIGYGLMASLERYAEVRRRYPQTEMLMGVGNLTELTAADSTGINAVLLAICQELGVRAVLSTEVTPWAHGAIRELDVARRLMHYAVTGRTLPKGVDDRLLTTKDPAILSFPERELRALQSTLTDPNFRIFTDEQGITVVNRDRYIRGTNARAIFEQLAVTDASHAFYLGTELARAQLAVHLGKTYRQDGQLNWGYLTPPDEVQQHVHLTRGSGPPDDEPQ